MAATSLVRSDSSLLSRLDRQFYRLETFFALLSGLAVFALMLLAVVSVGGRNIAGQPLPGYIDWIEQAMPLIAFMGISYVQRDGGHIRMDMFIGQLRGRALYLAELVTTFGMLLLVLLLVWGSYAHFDRSFDFSAPLWSRDSSMDIGLPIWPAKLLAPVAFSLLAVRLVMQIIAYAGAVFRGDDHPAAVPLLADVATIAAMEAEQLTDMDDNDDVAGDGTGSGGR